MNLADAIRLAAQSNGSLVPEPRLPQLEVVEAPAKPAPEKKPAKAPAPAASIAPEPASPAVANGGVVRLELFLSPDQMSNLFRAIVANQHLVMTLREAAQYLRVPSSQLEKLAQEGGVPALMIDGKFRFSRTALDEWLNLQGRQKDTEA
jgi:excisionase family DNA binding protein